MHHIDVALNPIRKYFAYNTHCPLMQLIGKFDNGAKPYGLTDFGQDDVEVSMQAGFEWNTMQFFAEGRWTTIRPHYGKVSPSP